jgi:hypothetical protein
VFPPLVSPPIAIAVAIPLTVFAAMVTSVAIMPVCRLCRDRLKDGHPSR